ncbi:hypothetical protein F3Y22_tig00116989pilonHSYRG00225 [Hibiscus syriacus]|uniref:Uncharacterized protein n=1 Tax=Hibiscus syriacus TaxID=106335 RepID=A0A6A2WFL2_HIBSY|nr:hypothetical protein F3Y22_tig00116989pilonHSYRG00225 [Hibiscus syriacus]
MENRSSYVPPPYIPLAQSDEEIPPRPVGEVDGESRPSPPQSYSVQWSSGICACFGFLRLHRSSFPLLFVRKECRVSGFWLLFGLTWIGMLYLLLCLWISKDTSLQIQFAGLAKP